MAIPGVKLLFIAFSIGRVGSLDSRALITRFVRPTSLDSDALNHLKQAPSVSGRKNQVTNHIIHLHDQFVIASLLARALIFIVVIGVTGFYMVLYNVYIFLCGFIRLYTVYDVLYGFICVYIPVIRFCVVLFMI